MSDFVFMYFSVLHVPAFTVLHCLCLFLHAFLSIYVNYHTLLFIYITHICSSPLCLFMSCSWFILTCALSQSCYTPLFQYILFADASHRDSVLLYRSVLETDFKSNSSDLFSCLSAWFVIVVHPTELILFTLYSRDQSLPSGSLII